jgi:hypothetical protein
MGQILTLHLTGFSLSLKIVVGGYNAGATRGFREYKKRASMGAGAF